MFPDVEYFTDRDFFLENQIVCIVSREGTKFCSLIENRLFMRSQSRHISKRMQLHIMCEIHRLAAIAKAADFLVDFTLPKKVGQSLCGCPAFFYFCRVESKKKVIRLKNLNNNILE